MSEYLIQDTTLDAIANAINAKTGGSSAMTPAEMVTAIGSISGGGGGGWELISDSTASEDVATINIEIPFAKRGMNVYKVELTGETSASEWIYFRANSTGSQTGGNYLPQTRQYSDSFIAAKRGYRNAGYVISPGGNSSDAKTTVNIENIFMNLYNSSSRFKSGFNVKLWGCN